MVLVTTIKNSPVFGTIMLGLIWAVAWAPIAILIGIIIIDPDNSMDEMWIAVGAFPGFLCGVAFRTLLGIARACLKKQSFKLLVVAEIGAGAGFLVGMLPFIAAGSNFDPLPLLHRLAIMGSIVGLSTLSAVITARVSSSSH